MLKELLDFVNSVLPSVDPEALDNAKAAIDQFNKTGQDLSYVMRKPLPQISQGDIVSKIPFFYYNENGDMKKYVTEGLILSTSCHIDQKEYYNIVPLLPLKFEMNKNSLVELKANRIYNYMYLPNSIVDDKFVDFSMMNTYNGNLIKEGINTSRIQRVCSLSQLGYYLLIIKLTVYFMRKEDDTTLSNRDTGVD